MKLSEKPLSEGYDRIVGYIVIRHRGNIPHQIIEKNIKEQVVQLEAELETYRERHRDAKSNFATIQRLREENKVLRTFTSAERQTLEYGRDYSLAAYMLRDLPITKRAELDDLCHEMSKRNASRGDWDGLKQHWLNALLEGDKDGI